MPRVPACAENTSAGKDPKVKSTGLLPAILMRPSVAPESDSAEHTEAA
eukprot:CAMPEP_0115100064 /NCGR_PEP_ID=MMETSP0227-20121206/32286_1 /TAXON_ID=89957 /ORGANISM="Polarella glacialis, Strain CCMP 1383" /LENGTH=47 /DNA_ID= /DNA_START= /DNA_END= /DNA_ORIENTATION=